MTTVKVELDIASEDESEEIETALEEARRAYNVTVTYLRVNGSTGWPLYEVSGALEDVRRMMVEWYDTSERDLDEMWPELALPVPHLEEPPGVTGWFLEHPRASGSSTCRWGPFATADEANAWATERGLRAGIVPLYMDVDWDRKD